MKNNDKNYETDLPAKNDGDIIDELFDNENNQDDDTKPGQLWQPGDGSQSKLFKNTAFISFAAGIIIGGIFIFFFGKYM